MYAGVRSQKTGGGFYSETGNRGTGETVIIPLPRGERLGEGELL